jgi:hypothetical protein
VLAHSLPDLVRRPPIAVVILDLVRAQDPLRGFEDQIWSDLRAIDPSTTGRYFLQLDVEPHQLVLSRYDHQGPRIGTVHDASISDVGSRTVSFVSGLEFTAKDRRD